MDAYDTYTCVVCCEDFFASEGIAACWEHFTCNSCGVMAFEVAMSNADTFPAMCCKEPGQLYNIELFEHLLDAEFVQRYQARLREYSVPEDLKVYCCNKECSAFFPPYSFDNSDYCYTLASCKKCKAITCVACKKQWDRGHRCESEAERNKLPDWVPEYTAECRMKRCPKCHALIEHLEACNHMTCMYCKHEFCFICLMRWGGFHEDLGCPNYGEPPAGYDEERYEQTSRGLHRDTGLDRNGLNRDGVEVFNEEYSEGEDFDHQEVDYFEDGQEEFDDQYDYDHQQDNGWDWNHDDRGDWDHGHHDQVPTMNGDQSPTSDPTPFVDHSVYLLPYPPPLLNFRQIDCKHTWSYHSTKTFEVSFCQLCKFRMPSFYYECSICHVHECAYCHSDRERFDYFINGADVMVGPILWAEQGFPPFREKSPELNWMEEEFGDLGITEMFEEYWEKVFKLEPFTWWDYGIEDMFAPFEQEVDAKDPYVGITDVGLLGCTFTFRADANYFWVLGG